MIDGKKVLAIIPARGGSKGVPRKNIRLLAGRPLIAWTIEAAKKSKHIDRLIVSSDDAEIIRVAKTWNCEVPFVRPAEYARDDTPGIDPVLHALAVLAESYEYVVLLQPTSPMRTVIDIDECIEKCVSQNAFSCVSVCEVDKSPYWMFALEAGDRLKPIIPRDKIIARRQDAPRVYVLNGAVYVARVEELIKTRSFISEDTVAYEMSCESSCDLDKSVDFEMVEALMKRDA